MHELFKIFAKNALPVSLGLGSIALFVLGGVLAADDKVAASGTVFVATIVLLIFVRLSRFRRFKAFGMEAELWEEKQEEAAALIQQLKGLSVAMAEPLISISSRMGRWSSHFSRRDHYDLIQKIQRALSANSLSQPDIDLMMKDYHRFVIIDFE